MIIRRFKHIKYFISLKNINSLKTDNYEIVKTIKSFIHFQVNEAITFPNPSETPGSWPFNLVFRTLSPGPEVIKLFSCSKQVGMVGMKFIMLIIFKMLTTVGILTFIRRINDLFR